MTNSSDVTAGTNATATQYNNLRKDWYTGAKTLYTESDSSTITFDMDNSNLQLVQLAGNRTLAVDNDSDGMVFTIILKQDATGSRTVTWWSGIAWIGGTTPTLTTTATKRDVFTFVRESSGVYLGFIVGQNV